MPKANRILETATSVFCKIFHKRSIIILSEQKVRHIHISGWLQFIAVTGLIGSFCWSSYSTGSFMAARDKLREQGETIRSVASDRVDNNFNSLLASAVQPSGKKRTGEYKPTLSPSTLSLTMTGHDKLFERISMLEGQVAELKQANDSIINTVREKTGGRISELERIIRHTGLDMNTLKRRAVAQASRRAAPVRTSLDAGGPDLDPEMEESYSQPEEKGDERLGKGGPYIAEESGEYSHYYATQQQEIAERFDRLMLLGEVVKSLPLARPMQGGVESSGFGRRVDPFTGRLAFHAGFDLSGPSGSKVYSAGEGVVTFAGRSGAYGQMVDVDHGLGITTRYGHLRRITVQKGQRVGPHDVLGVQGSTGRSTGDHLHYEVRFNKKPLNPKNFLDAPYAVQ